MSTDAACGEPIPGGWQPAILMVQTSNTSGPMNGGGYVGGSLTPSIGIPNTPIIQTSPHTTIQTIQPLGPWPPMTASNPPPEEPDECRDGHYVDSKSIRVVRGGDEEEEIFGLCLFCDETIYIPHIVAGLTFEKAGSAVGRAMTLEDGDDEAIGPLLADLSALEREVNAEIARYKRALGMIKIARDLADQRATA